MMKRLVVSPEVLLLGASPAHGDGIARALREILERHGMLPLSVIATEHRGEVYVEEDQPKRGWVKVDQVRFAVASLGHLFPEFG